MLVIKGITEILVNFWRRRRRRRRRKKMEEGGRKGKESSTLSRKFINQTHFSFLSTLTM